jgi:hypoxanthine phosphoribosyltransferase
VATPLKRILGWDDISRLVDRLLDQLPRGYYDVLLVVTRGGLAPACLISEQMGLTNIVVAAVELTRNESADGSAPRFLQFPESTLLLGRRVLVVDDVWDSGRTAMAVLERVRGAGGAPELAVLHYKPRASQFPQHAPDFFGEQTDDWIVYPWDAHTNHG